MGKTKIYKGKFLTFYQARKITRKLGLKSKREWEQLKDKPKNIPFNPHVPYKKYGWTNYPDFLNYKPYKPREKFLPFEQAREFVRSLGFKKAKADWAQYSRSGKRPENIPSTPKVVYKGKYKGLRDWVGLPEKNFLPFTKARKKARAAEDTYQIPNHSVKMYNKPKSVVAAVPPEIKYLIMILYLSIML